MTSLLHTLNTVSLSGLVQEQGLIVKIGTKRQISKLDGYVVFKVTVCAVLWLVGPFPASDPVNDLYLAGIVPEFAPHGAIHY